MTGGVVDGVHVADGRGRAVDRDVGPVGAPDVDRREVAEAVARELAQDPGVPDTGRLGALGVPVAWSGVSRCWRTTVSTRIRAAK